MLDTFIVPQNTVITAKGDSAAADISGAASRIFLLTLDISQVIEQESLDVSIYGSADGNAWGQKPLVSFPQKFYRGRHPSLLDLSQQPQIKFLRAHWEVNRWGRGEPTPRFELSLAIQEVAPELLGEVAAETARTES